MAPHTDTSDVWHSREGPIRVVNMSDRHLNNAMALIRRKSLLLVLIAKKIDPTTNLNKILPPIYHLMQKELDKSKIERTDREAAKR